MRPVGLVRSVWPHSVQGSSIHRKAIRLWIISVVGLGFRLCSFLFMPFEADFICGGSRFHRPNSFSGSTSVIGRALSISSCRVLSHDTAETEHGQVHGDKYDGHEQADQQDQHGFEQVPQQAEAVLELSGQYVAFSGEHFG